MTDSTKPGRELLVPMTGELIDLNSPTDVLADATKRMRDLEQDLARLRASIATVIVARMDHENLRTAEIGDYVVTVDAPGGVDWDTKGLEAVLWTLVDHDSISASAMDRVMPLKRGVGVRELKKLLAALPDEQQKQIEDCSAPSKKVRRVRVEAADRPAVRV